LILNFKPLDFFYRFELGFDSFESRLARGAAVGLLKSKGIQMSQK
ncbi:12686_t:CDS:1, partial [Racocetra fulgida]